MKPPILPRPILFLTYYFIKNHGRHFLKLFLRYSWWAWILLIACLTIIPYMIMEMLPTELIEKNDMAALQEHILKTVGPEKVLLFWGAISVMVVCLYFIFIFTPNYYLLFTNYFTSFSLSDVRKTIASRFSRILLYFISAIVIAILLTFPLYFIILQFAGSMLGGIFIPLILGIVYIGFAMAFIEFITVNTTILSAFSFGFKTAISRLGRLTINFVFLVFTSVLLTTFIQQGILYLYILITKNENIEDIKMVGIISAVITNAFLFFIFTYLQLYISIGYHEFEIENNHLNSEKNNKVEDDTNNEV